ncbi:capsular biosynthesis protein [Escherichia sp. E4694]|uniref:capsular polysaccharide export protein, LipB/KpsS family n=1 Tax=Escherichia sp. E4694 TaxID=2044464 RepID=UPI0010FDD7FC|nr:capsular biosynthesis protein [Escherichia sp. E4694]TLJ01408.1 capsular biosynthesis protein [Escherichia sp. E4694]
MRNYILRKMIRKDTGDNFIIKAMFYVVFRDKMNLRFLKSNFEQFIKENDFKTNLDYCDYIISKFPNNKFGYIQKSNLYLSINNKEAAKKIINESPIDINNKHIENKKQPVAKKNSKKNIIKISDAEIKKMVSNCKYNEIIDLLQSKLDECSLEQVLILAKSFQQIGKHTEAYKTLIDAQVKFPNERKILMRLGEILQNDKKIPQAHIYFKAAKIFYPEYGTVKKLSFEVDNELWSNALETLNEILLFSTLSHLKFLPVLNRVSPFFPDKRDTIISIRNNVQSILWKKKGKKGTNPNNQVKIAIKCRWLALAESIILRNVNGSQPVSDSIIHWLNTVKEYQKGYELFFSLANHNDENKKLKGFLNGNEIELNHDEKLKFKCVEVFIPSVFFTNPAEEKPSYHTVRNFFVNIYSCLLTLENIIVVPRNQWNWRKCEPIINNAYVISYHTRSMDMDNKKHLHIQESTLAERCSMDYMGYAGYSSLADDFTYKIIDNYSKHINNIEQQISFYIKNNISKYKQSDEEFHLESDYVFIPMQVTTDAVASLSYIDGIKLLKLVSEYFFNTSTKVVVKRHPYCNSIEVEKLINELEKEGKIIVSDSSVHHLIKASKAVITVNSGVGLETVIHNKPVIITGKSDYYYAATAIAKNGQELRDIISDLESLNINEVFRKKFLAYYFLEYAIPYYSVDKIHSNLLKFLNS